MSNKGFGSLTKQMRKITSAKGGKAVQLKGTGHKLDEITARAAALRGVASRRRRQARVAAQELLQSGLSPEQLHSLDLSEAELIYYGGSKRTRAKFDELLARLAALGG